MELTDGPALPAPPSAAFMSLVSLSSEEAAHLPFEVVLAHLKL